MKGVPRYLGTSHERMEYTMKYYNAFTNYLITHPELDKQLQADPELRAILHHLHNGLWDLKTLVLRMPALAFDTKTDAIVPASHPRAKAHHGTGLDDDDVTSAAAVIASMFGSPTLSAALGSKVPTPEDRVAKVIEEVVAGQDAYDDEVVMRAREVLEESEAVNAAFEDEVMADEVADIVRAEQAAEELGEEEVDSAQLIEDAEIEQQIRPQMEEDE